MEIKLPSVSKDWLDDICRTYKEETGKDISEENIIRICIDVLRESTKECGKDRITKKILEVSKVL
ncbi:MAG: hypothetical protein GY853_00885 [PVC group bacterium]|nr:hypothetical protein [PVC group bacterium]